LKYQSLPVASLQKNITKNLIYIHMKKHLYVYFFILSCLNSQLIFAQGFTPTEYKKALWMTTRMYGGQRSGANNWLVYNHLPSGMTEPYRGMCFIDDKDTDGYDLSGGWHDCGDHVKFGQTLFYSAYMLLKGYAEFPTGYDDRYTYNYMGYKTGGNWTFEGTNHDPNGIPDVLDEVKHATDYFIKCTRNASTFYYQVGQGNPDHTKWVTAVQMQALTQAEGGQTRVVYKNPVDASMPSFCGATLALMSRVYRKYDPAYADLCLQHANYAYAYAKANPGLAATGDGGFYTANDNWKDDYADMCAELYWATGTLSYKTEALSFSIAAAPGAGGDIYGKNYGFDYTNNGDIAIYNLALLGKANAQATLNTIVNTYYLGNTQPDGQFAGGNTGWGPLRYNANSAFIVALWQKLYGTDNTPNKYIYDNIDYILGKNTASQSFIVGFGAKSPLHPHHRNVYLRDDNPADAIKNSISIPTKNMQFGLMVGGTRTPGSFSDNLVNYQNTEGGIDYNACLVGALAFINSKLAPVDTNRFGHPSPNLGPTQSICGVSSLLLDSKITPDGLKTFTWKKDDIVVSAASTSKNKFSVSTAGKYTCVLDSAGKWSTQSSVVITGTLPDVVLGPDQQLCNPATATLDMGVTGTGISYQWQKNTVVINGASSKTYTVYTAGTYRGTISASGCPSKFADITITSKLPAAKNDTLCAPGKASLAINGTGGPYEWYDANTAGTLLMTGTTYQPTITSSQTYYVRDAGSLTATAVPVKNASTLLNPQNGGNVGIRFTALTPFTITQLKLLPYVYSCAATDKVSIQLQLKQGGVVLATYNSDQVACTGVQSGIPFNTYYTLNFATPISIPSAGNYELVPSLGNTAVWFDSGANFTAMSVSGVITITDDTRDDKPNSFPGIFDLAIQAGSTCARTPVFAVINSNRPSCIITDVNTVLASKDEWKVFPNPASGNFNLTVPADVTIKIYDNLGKMVMEFQSISQQNFGQGLPQGVYHVTFLENNKIVKAINIVKN
jgi:hypothetical protein